MRKIRIFQQSGYMSLDLAAGTGEFFRLRGDVDLARSSRRAPLALEEFVERVPLEAPEGEPLRLEFESFVARGARRAAVAVTGEDGREALEVALRIVSEIERTLPSLAARAARRRRSRVREVLFVAGEASGDLHAAASPSELEAAATRARARRASAGARMERAGVELIERYERLAVMGFVEVLRHIPRHYALLRQLQRAASHADDVGLLVLIDYPAST